MNSHPLCLYSNKDSGKKKKKKNHPKTGSESISNFPFL